eukprot:gene19070-biopygen20501
MPARLGKAGGRGGGACPAVPPPARRGVNKWGDDGLQTARARGRARRVRGGQKKKERKEETESRAWLDAASPTVHAHERTDREAGAPPFRAGLWRGPPSPAPSPFRSRLSSPLLARNACLGPPACMVADRGGPRHRCAIGVAALDTTEQGHLLAYASFDNRAAAMWQAPNNWPTNPISGGVTDTRSRHRTVQRFSKFSRASRRLGICSTSTCHVRLDITLHLESSVLSMNHSVPRTFAVRARTCSWVPVATTQSSPVQPPPPKGGWPSSLSCAVRIGAPGGCASSGAGEAISDAPRAPQPTPERGAGRRRGSAGGAPAAACGLSSSLSIGAGAALRRRLGGGGAGAAPPGEGASEPEPEAEAAAAPCERAGAARRARCGARARCSVHGARGRRCRRPRRRARVVVVVEHERCCSRRRRARLGGCGVGVVAVTVIVVIHHQGPRCDSELGSESDRVGVRQGRNLTWSVSGPGVLEMSWVGVETSLKQRDCIDVYAEEGSGGRPARAPPLIWKIP